MIAQRRMLARLFRNLAEQAHAGSVKARLLDDQVARDVMRAAILLREAAGRIGRSTLDGGSLSWQDRDR